MTLKWLYKNGRDREGDKLERYYLINEDTGQVIGCVDPPQLDELVFTVDHFHDGYISMETAQEALTQFAEAQEAAAVERLEKSVGLRERVPSEEF